MKTTQVWSVIQEDPTCPRATKPWCHNYCGCAREPGATTAEPACCSYGSLRALEPVRHRKEKPAREKPPQREACTLQPESSPGSLHLEKCLLLLVYCWPGSLPKKNSLTAGCVPIWKGILKPIFWPGLVPACWPF